MIWVIWNFPKPPSSKSRNGHNSRRPAAQAPAEAPRQAPQRHNQNTIGDPRIHRFPANSEEMAPESPKRQEPLGGIARTHSTGRRKPKNPEHIRQSLSCTTRQPPENAQAAPATPTPESHHHLQIPCLEV